MKPLVDHIHITVNDLPRAEVFYDKLLPLIGFNIKNKEIAEVPEHKYKIIEYHSKYMSFGIINPRVEFRDIKINRRRPGTIHHIAFRADSKNEVDEIYNKIKKLNIKIVNDPKYYKEYCPDYYAFFFKDSENIEYEIVHFNREKYFDE
ncbi:hypothetical protein FACS189450_14520 [Spirochaetia bacterium]|nr:hypothetical protein FACS189450_14520 [Spirochaetia bacterium]